MKITPDLHVILASEMDENSSEDDSSIFAEDTGSSMVADFNSPNEPVDVVEDITGEDDLLSDRSSPASLTVNNGTPNIKPRAYQTEMLEESLARNIIVAVSPLGPWKSCIDIS